MYGKSPTPNGTQRTGMTSLAAGSEPHSEGRSRRGERRWRRTGRPPAGRRRRVGGHGVDDVGVRRRASSANTSTSPSGTSRARSRASRSRSSSANGAGEEGLDLGRGTGRRPAARRTRRATRALDAVHTSAASSMNRSLADVRPPRAPGRYPTTNSTAKPASTMGRPNRRMGSVEAWQKRRTGSASSTTRWATSSSQPMPSGAPRPSGRSRTSPCRASTIGRSMIGALASIKGATAAEKGRRKLLSKDEGGGDPRRRGRGRQRGPRRPVPGRRVPDRLGHVVEHEHERGHRHPGRRAPRRARPPNDDVNAPFSSNDVFPSAIHVAAARDVRARPAARARPPGRQPCGRKARTVPHQS